MDLTFELKPPALLRVLAVWLVEILGLRLLDLLLPGLAVGGTLSAALAVAALGLVNALVWPGLMRFTLRLTVLSAGGLTLLLNAFTVWGLSLVVPGFGVADLGTAALTSLGLTAVNAFVSSVAHLGREHSYYRNVVLRRMQEDSRTTACDTPGICFVEIDGLSRRVLEKAVAGGWMPTVAAWIERGSHRVHGWECDLSSQTASSQAGILHGNNQGIVAFRWYEKDSGTLVRASSPMQIQRIESRLSDGRGLLVRGASRTNMLSGDAPDSILTSSTILDSGRHRTESYYAFFADPYNFNRTLLLFLWEVLVEMKDALVQKVRGEHPRVRRAGAFPLMRAGMTVLLREVTTHVVIADLFAGVPVVYATYSGYDEVAHHAGVARKETLKVLRQIDGQLARLEQAVHSSPRPYHFVLLSDHGQSEGPTFRQRWGTTLQEEVRRLVQEKGRVLGATTANEGWGHLNAVLTELVQGRETTMARMAKRALRRRMHQGQVVLGPEREDFRGAPRREGEDDVVVLASGSLGLIYLPARPQRMILEEIAERYPGLVPGLVEHEGIGFVMVRSEEHGAMVLGRDGVHFLDRRRVEGRDPLLPYGPHAARHLARTDGFEHCPDLLVNATYDAQRDEICAFEELVGSHGGLGGDQGRPFVVAPTAWPVPEEELVGAESLYHLFRGWIEGLHGPFPDPPGSGAEGEEAVA